MSIAASDIVTGVYQLLGRPSQGDLPYLDIMDYVRDVAHGRILDMKLSARGHTTQIGAWVTPSAREMSSSGFVGGLDNFIPVKVEWRYLSEASASPAVMPRRAEVVAFDQMNDMSQRAWGNEVYVSFYDGFTNIAFSENATILALKQFRIVYEDTEGFAKFGIAVTLDLPEIFLSLCKYEVALLCLDQIRNEKFTEERERLRGVFTAQFMLWDARFKKWQMSAYGNKKVKKQGFRILR